MYALFNNRPEPLPLCWFCLPVAGVVWAGIVNADDDEDMLEMWADVFRGEGMSSWLLENDGDDIIPNVPFPQQLQKTKKNK